MKRTVLFFFLIVSAVNAFEYSGYCESNVSKKKPAKGKWTISAPTEDEIKSAEKIAADNQMKIRRHAKDKCESYIGETGMQLRKMRELEIPESKAGYVKITMPDIDLIIVPTLYISHEDEQDLFKGCCDIISTVVLKKNKVYTFMGFITGWMKSIEDKDKDGIPELDTEGCGCNDNNSYTIFGGDIGVDIYPLIKYPRSECLKLADDLAKQNYPEYHSDYSLDYDLVACKVMPDDTGKIIAVLPFAPADKDRRDVDVFDVEILIVNYDGKVLSRLYQKDAWENSAEQITGVGIDTARYWLSPGIRAFGVTVHRNLSSYRQSGSTSYLSLYIAKSENIVQIMDEIWIDLNNVEWTFPWPTGTTDEETDGDPCGEESSSMQRVLSIDSKKNNG